jgi:hypothetical protein
MNLAALIEKLYMGLVTLQIMGIPPKIKKLAEIISDYEGFEVGMRAHRNKNPGNCRYYNGGYAAIYGVVKKDKDGFAIFSDVERGWLYLQKMLTGWAKGKKAEYTILQMMKEYAPSADHNDPEAYAKYITERLGLSAQTKLKDLL